VNLFQHLPDSFAQVLFSEGKFQWKRLENLIELAKEGAGARSTLQQASPSPNSSPTKTGSGGLDLSDTVKDGLRVLLLDEKLRKQVAHKYNC